jgi:hypothetical protein
MPVSSSGVRFAVKHRHIEAQSDVAAEALSSAEIVDLLHRGDLSDWRPLLTAISRAPEGVLANRVLELVDLFPTYGTSGLLRPWIDQRRVAARSLEARAPAASLRLLRQRRGLTQVQLAEQMHMTQPDLSKLERRRDVRLPALAAYIAALGGRLDLCARLPVGTCRITLARRRARSAKRWGTCAGGGGAAAAEIAPGARRRRTSGTDTRVQQEGAGAGRGADPGRWILLIRVARPGDARGRAVRRMFGTDTWVQ